MSHTPGPWHLEVDYPCSYNGEGVTGRCAILDKPDGFVIATTQGDVHEIRDTERPNARLMAAAPEMLDALKAAFAELSTDDAVGTRARMLMHAAIAKAEGR